MSRRPAVTPELFRGVISTVLAVGVATSAAIIGIGFVGALAVGWDGSLLGAAAGTDRVSDFGRLLDGLAVLRPAAIVQLGLLALIATPVVRVAASLVGFLLERDWSYVVITAVVFGILMASLFLIR